jgi:hypothetical protein
MQVNCQLQAQAALSQEIVPDTHWRGVYVRPRVGLIHVTATGSNLPLTICSRRLPRQTSPLHSKQTLLSSLLTGRSLVSITTLISVQCQIVRVP